MTTKSIGWFLRHVEGQIGASEHPLGSNQTEFGKQFGWNGVSWCVEFAWCMFTDASVVLPAKTAACVVLYDAAVKAHLRYDSYNCVPGDVVIRTWEEKSRATLNPSETHCQIVVGTHTVNGVKYLDLIGGNQGAGYVSRDTVRAGDVTILGGLAFHRLFEKQQATPAKADKRRDTPHLPKKKSHPHPLAAHKQSDAADLTGELGRRHKPLPHGKGSGRGKLRALAAQIRRLLHGGTK